MPVDRERLKSLPAVDEVLRRSEVRALADALPRWVVTAAVRQEIADRRRAILAEEPVESTEIGVGGIKRRVEVLLRPALRPVINATGVVVHTNLGRAPLSAPAADRLVEVARGYSNLEYELEGGRRGSRHEHLRRIASELCGGEDAVITNNNAAAVLLTVSALATGREVIVSRGELVEIGGGFRIPDVIVQGGARLREVGTTNRTRVTDYRQAIGPETAALLKVHPSNFELVGFTEEADIAQLAGLAREAGLPLVADLGSGAMLDSYGSGLTGEPVVRRALDEGADLVCFSGDKLLGGPQAGVILGKKELVATIRRHPLMRALRPCKLTLSALEATLELWRDGRDDEIPVRRMLATDQAASRRRARRLARRLKRVSGWSTTIIEVEGRAGGGSLPGRSTPGWAVALGHESAGVEAIEAGLRAGSPPIVARIIDDQVVIDLRTVAPAQERALLERLTELGAELEVAAVGGVKRA